MFYRSEKGKVTNLKEIQSILFSLTKEIETPREMLPEPFLFRGKVVSQPQPRLAFPFHLRGGKKKKQPRNTLQHKHRTTKRLEI